MSRSTRSKIILFTTVMALFIAIGTVNGVAPQPLIDLYDRLTGGADPSLAEDISVTHGDATLTLTNASASASETIVEFQLTSPELPDDLEGMFAYTVAPSLLPPDNIKLNGFASDSVVNRSETRKAGAFQILLELPAPAEFGQPVSIEFTELTLSPFTGDATKVPLGGPWRFEFTPTVADVAQTMETIPLGLEGGDEFARVVVDQMERSNAETVISYRLLPPTHPNTQTLAPETLWVDGQPLESVSSDTTTSAEAVEQQAYSVQYAALPAQAKEILFTVGPFWQPQDAPVDVTLSIEKLRSGGQEVNLNDHDLLFWLDLSSDGAGELLAYRPVGTTAIPYTLAVPLSEVSIVDDLGYAYPVVGGSTQHESATTRLLQEQSFRITEPLHEGATSLTLHSSMSGMITEAVQIVIPAP